MPFVFFFLFVSIFTGYDLHLNSKTRGDHIISHLYVIFGKESNGPISSSKSLHPMPFPKHALSVLGVGHY